MSKEWFLSLPPHIQDQLFIGNKLRRQWGLEYFPAPRKSRFPKSSRK
jgi:hypothetical protein